MNIFLADDDVVFLFTAQGILRSAGYTVETFEHPQALLTRLSARDQGCVVLDLQMPALSGLEVQRLLVDRAIALPVIFVSGRANVPAAVAAMKQGAVDFLTKPVDPDALLAVVGEALRSSSLRAAAHSNRELARARFAELSPRQQEVCRLFAKGLINKQIGAVLGTAESTVQAQRALALKKLGISSSTDLTSLIGMIDAKD